MMNRHRHPASALTRRTQKRGECPRRQDPVTQSAKVMLAAAMLCATAGLMPATSASAAAVPVPWTAHWIGPDQSAANQWICFRTSFALDEVPDVVPTRLAVDSKYWLWANGEPVIREGGLKRGPTPSGSYYDALDLAPFLAAGSNTLAVLVWHFGRHGFSHNSSGRAGLVLEAGLGDTLLRTDAGWKMRIHPAFGTASGPAPNYRLPEASIRFDARQDLSGWTTKGYDDSDWDRPVVFGVPPAAPWGSLVERPIPFWKDYGLRAYENAADLPSVSDGGVIVVRLPYNAHVTPFLRIDAPAGLLVGMRTDNFLGGSAPNVHAEYITREGEQAFEAFGWMNGHEVHYALPAGIRILDLQYRETGFDAEFAGAFRCDDPFLNRLWEKARRTLYVTMRDTYMDCPDRERAQWWGDAVNELGEVFYAFEPGASSLTRKGILELVRWQRPDGTLYAPVPAGIPADGGRRDHGDGTWYSELPAQMLASIGHYGFRTYAFYSGDEEILGTVYPHVRDYLRVWTFDEDGLVVHRPGDWNWSDWGENIDAPILDNAWYVLALQAAVEMARVAGAEADIPEWLARKQAIEAVFHRRHWTGSSYRSPAYTGETDDRAQAMAVVAGLAPPETYPAIRTVLNTAFHASPYMEKYVLEALYRMNAPEQAVARMKTRYAPMVESGLTTLWEGWGLGDEGFGGGTYNHAWSGGPLTLLSQYAAGIAPTKPAFAAYHVLPQLGPLRQVACTVPTRHGDIRVTLHRDENAFRAELSSPAGTTAELGIPHTAGRRPAAVRLNGRSIGPEDPRWAGADDRFTRIRLAPGAWTVEAELE